MAGIEKILNEREKSHGSFATQSALSMDLLNRLTQSSDTRVSWDLLRDYEREALIMICVKLGRLMTKHVPPLGATGRKQHWEDIAGYASLVTELLEMPKKK